MNNHEEIDYFKDYFSNSEQNDTNEINSINNNNNENNNIFNNNLYSNSFNNKDNYSNNTNNISHSSSFNSFSSTNPGNFNSISNSSFFNSASSFNNLPFPLSFQYNNNIKMNSFNRIISNENKSDNQMKIFTKLTKKNMLEMSPQNLYIHLLNKEGSRQAQNIISKMKENEIDIILNKIFPFLSEIFKDKYGNYFSKKLIQVCLPYQRIKLLKNLENNFILLAESLYGTHPIQFLVETINMLEEKDLALKLIINNSIELALNQRGNCVLKKFIICTKDEERKELNINLINNIDKLILNQYGVIILVCLIKHSKDIIIQKQIADYITNNNSLFFYIHPYSNYVIQALLIHTDLKFCDEIIKTITNNYLKLSLLKNSNKIVENCIKHGKKSIAKNIFKDIIEKNNLECLLNNFYANFVLEKLIAELTKEEKNIMIKKIEQMGKINKINENIRNLLYK